jgi:hypothetical protein
MPEPLEQNLAFLYRHFGVTWRSVCFFTRTLLPSVMDKTELYPVAAFSRAVVDPLREAFGQGKRAQRPRF